MSLFKALSKLGISIKALCHKDTVKDNVLSSFMYIEIIYLLFLSKICSMCLLNYYTWTLNSQLLESLVF